jgi:uncharacterized membrane protein YgaE (UPF0421/DUF939 family)
MSSEGERLLQRMAVLSERLDTERRHELLEAAGARSRQAARGRLARLRASGWQIVQAASAAAVAWFIAATLLGHKSPFFAPLAALVALSATRGQRVRQALELMLGVAVGVGVGDVLIEAIGSGFVQLAIVVSLAMCVATLLKAGGILFTEAAVSAALVASVEPSTRGFPPVRFLDALIGGAVALVFSQLLFPAHPLRVVESAARSVLEGLAGILADVAAALEQRDLEGAEDALLRSRHVSGDWADFQRAIDVGQEAARYAPRRRRLRGRMSDYEDVGLPLDLLVRDVQVLARAAVRTLRIGDRFPSTLVASTRDLAGSAAEVAGQFDDSDGQREARELALDAVRGATASAREQNLSLGMLAGQTQATAADLLRTLGLDRDSAHDAVGQAALEIQEAGYAGATTRTTASS